MAKRCKDNYQKAINIFMYNNKDSGSAEVMALKNKIGELDFNEANFSECEETMR